MFVAWDAIRKPLWRTKSKPATVTMECRRLVYPSYLSDAVNGAITLLTASRMWQVDGTDTVDATIEIMAEVYLSTVMECIMIGQVVSGVWSDLPDGTLPCDGSTYQRVDYPELYALIDPNLILNADEFITPVMDGSFPKSQETGQFPGDIGGEKEVSLTSANNGEHSHGYQQFTFGIDIESVGIPDPTGVGQPSTPRTTTNSGSGTPHNNEPRYTVLRFAVVAR